MRSFHDWFLTGISLRGEDVRLEFCPPRWTSEGGSADESLAVLVDVLGVSLLACSDVLKGNIVDRVELSDITQANASAIARRLSGAVSQPYFGSIDEVTRQVLTAAANSKRVLEIEATYGANLCAICRGVVELS